MRNILIVFILSLSLVHAQTLSAAQSEALNQFHLDVDLKIKLFSSMIQVNQQLVQAHEEIEAKNLAPSEFDRQYSQQFRAITQEYIQTQLSHGQATQEQLSTVSRIMSQLNWDKLSQAFRSTYGAMRVFTRNHGFGLLAVVIVANIIQYSLGYALVLAGQPVLALTLTQLPTTPPSIYAHHVISNARLKNQMTQELGGPEAYRDYIKMKKDVLTHLHLNHANDVFVPIQVGNSSAIILNQATMFTRVAQLFNLASDKLTITSLRAFLRNQNIEVPLLETLLRDSTISEFSRMTMGLNYMADQLSSEQFALFKHQFSKNFIDVSLPDQSFEELHRWIKAAVTSKTKHDLEAVLRNPPTTAHPLHVLESWEKIIMPELARGDQLSYNDIRQLASRFHSIKIENEMRPEPISHNNLRRTLTDYFQTSLNRRVNQCFKSQQEIIVELLKTH